VVEGVNRTRLIILADVTKERHDEPLDAIFDCSKPTPFINVLAIPSLMLAQLELLYLITLFSILWMLFRVLLASIRVKKPKLFNFL
jgi:hypothetical protein